MDTHSNPMPIAGWWWWWREGGGAFKVGVISTNRQSRYLKSFFYFFRANFVDVSIHYGKTVTTIVQ